ncbi:MAG: polyprenyl synthetase family protein [Dermabacter sp.]|nr:polyprenyl synthetase family protein [Dermabacter sp.]
MSPHLDAWVRDSVTRTLTDLLAAERTRLGSIAPELGGFVDVLGDFLVGGKYLRPQCVAIGALAAGARLDSPDGEAIATLGAAVELVQAAALMHDDVIDHSPTRRGRDAVHVAAANDHARAGHAGSSSDFGIATAVVLGDLSLSLSEQVAQRVLRGEADRAQFDALRTEVMAGQYLDILNQAGALASAPSAHEAALTVIRWKTVPYTFLRPLLLGATHAGASDALAQALADLAIPLGTAFQLRDDLLGVFGDERATGKSASGDITEGKRTTLLAYAEAHADAEGRLALAAAVGHADASPAQIEAARQVMITSGARAHVEAHVRELEAEARAVLETAIDPLAEAEAVGELDALISAATGIADA